MKEFWKRLNKTCARLGIKPTQRVIFVRIDTQTLQLFDGGKLVRGYAISTSARPPSNIKDSLGTPRGLHEIAERIGGGQPAGMIFKSRQPTGFLFDGSAVSPKPYPFSDEEKPVLAPTVPDKSAQGRVCETLGNDEEKPGALKGRDNLPEVCGAPSGHAFPHNEYPGSRGLDPGLTCGTPLACKPRPSPLNRYPKPPRTARRAVPTLDVPPALVTSRILWLRGLEPGVNLGGDVDSHERYIYIHGTNREDLIGTPQSAGCVVMRNADVVALYDQVREGDMVLIA